MRAKKSVFQVCDYSVDLSKRVSCFSLKCTRFFVFVIIRIIYICKQVKGLTGRNTVLCLEHALKLLDTEKYKDTDVSQLQVLVHVSVKELNNVHDDMKRRLNIPTA